MKLSDIRIFIMLTCTFLLVGCGATNKQFIIVIYGTVSGLGLFCIGIILLFLNLFIRRKFLKWEGLFIVLISLLFILSFTVPFFTYSSDEFNYLLVLCNAFVAGFLFWISALVLRRIDKNIVKPIHYGIFGFILFFILTFGYVYVSGEFEKASQLGMISDEINRILLWSQLPYVSFFLAPLIVLTLWFFSRFKGESWTYQKLIRKNIQILTLTIISLILIISAINAYYLSNFKSLGVEDIVDYKRYYQAASSVRDIIFFNGCHNLIVGFCLALGYFSAGLGAEKLGIQRKHVLIASAVALILTATIPYFIGQGQLIDYLANNQNIAELARAGFREELIALHPLHPGSSTLQNLLVTLSGGGLMAVMVNVDNIIFSRKAPEKPTGT